MHRFTALRALCVLVLIASSSTSRAALLRQAPDNPAKVDAVFAKWTASTPGCSVGVAVGGKSVLERAYGMADLEHDVRNTPEDRKSTRLNSSHVSESRMPSSA